MRIKIEVEGAGPDEMRRYTEIFTALVATGSLTGVKGGKTIIHFDALGEFAKIELDYFPYVKRTTKQEGTTLGNTFDIMNKEAKP